MEKFGEYVKKSVTDFKLDLCCFVASVRTGALTLACLNVILGLIVLVRLSEPPEDEEAFEPLLLQALKALSDMEEDPPNFKPSCVLAYAAEIASNALVLCAMWRNDLILLRAYLYYALGVLTAAVMVYSVVFGTLPILPELLIVASVGSQLYQIMLVRSAMVEIKMASIKNGYTVSLRPNDTESGSGPSEKYTVTIEPEKPKLPLVIPVSKEDISKPILIKEVSKEELAKAVSKEGLAKQVSKEGLAKEVSKEGLANEATATVHSPAKDAFLRDKEVKEVKVKPSRIFGKEKAKIGDSKAKIEKVEDTKKVSML